MVEVSTFQIVVTSCPDQQTATTIAQQIVDKKLAACVNIIPQLTSIYRWQDKIEQSSECLLLIKTQQHVFAKLNDFISNHHPYDVPELVAIPLQQGNATFLQWWQNNLIA